VTASYEVCQLYYSIGCCFYLSDLWSWMFKSLLSKT